MLFWVLIIAVVLCFVGYKYEIRVPEGTIVQNYVVDVTK